MKPFYEKDNQTIYHGDCLEVLKTLPDNHVSSVIVDPPYELNFMASKWDDQGIAFNPEIWRECLRVAKPGAMLFACGGTRTHHRLACAIEDAGWEIRDCITYLHNGDMQQRAFLSSLSPEQFGAYMELHHPNKTMQWTYASGFPKSLSLEKAVDSHFYKQREKVIKECLGIKKITWSDSEDVVETITLSVDDQEIKVNRLGEGTFQKPDYLKEMERQVVGIREDAKAKAPKNNFDQFSSINPSKTGINTPAFAKKMGQITTPATAQARRWSGYFTSMAPSFEPIVVAMAPLDKTPWIIDLTPELLDEWEVQLESN